MRPVSYYCRFWGALIRVFRLLRAAERAAKRGVGVTSCLDCIGPPSSTTGSPAARLTRSRPVHLPCFILRSLSGLHQNTMNISLTKLYSHNSESIAYYSEPTYPVFFHFSLFSSPPPGSFHFFSTCKPRLLLEFSVTARSFSFLRLSCALSFAERVACRRRI